MGSACSLKISPQARSTVAAKPAWPEPTACVSAFLRQFVQIYVCPYMPEWMTVCLCVGVPNTLNVPESVCVCVCACEAEVLDSPSGRSAVEQRVKSWTMMQECNECTPEQETRKPRRTSQMNNSISHTHPIVFHSQLGE